MVNLIDDLRKDHALVIRALFEIKRQLISLNQIQTPTVEQYRDFENRTHEIREEIVVKHFTREEKVLFPELELIGVSVKYGPIELLLRDHYQINLELDRICVKATRLNGYSVSKRISLETEFDELTNQIERHVKTEESVLYEVARRHIPAEKLMEMSHAVIF